MLRRWLFPFPHAQKSYFFFLVALFGFGFFFSFINMVYVIIIIANYFFHLNYQTMHCSKQTHIKGFCTSMTFGFKTLSYHHVNTYPGPIFSIKRKAGIFWRQMESLTLMKWHWHFFDLRVGQNTSIHIYIDTYDNIMQKMPVSEWKCSCIGCCCQQRIVKKNHFVAHSYYMYMIV